jgi:hypothetical protein
MKTLWTALVGAYSRWRFVEDLDAPSRPVAAEAPKDEISRLRQTIDRERRNLADFLRFDLRALAGPCESSIRAMESRIRALEMRRAV